MKFCLIVSVFSLGATLTVCPATVRPDIFQWEYVDPLDPSLGKQESTTLAPCGAGADAVPFADLSYRDLTMAHLMGKDLEGVNANAAELTTADITGASVRGAQFDRYPRYTEDYYTGHSYFSGTYYGSGLTLAQLYSTASYQAGDLTGISLQFNALAGGDFADVNFSGANLESARLENADFTGAKITGANFNMYVRVTVFGPAIQLIERHGSGLTTAQLASTADYQTGDLSGIGLRGSNLSSANFTEMNLSGANLSRASLDAADFSHANLTNANLVDASIAGANLTGADRRGGPAIPVPSSAIDANLIRYNGHVTGLDLSAGEQLIVRDYDGNPNDTSREPLPPIPITVDQSMTMAAGSALRTVFEADAWDSTISFTPGIPVTLGGTLELSFAHGVNLESQLGRTLDLFDWTGVNPIGAFTISSPYTWDLSKLYTTGEVTLTVIPEAATVVLLTLAAPICVNRRRILAVS